MRPTERLAAPAMLLVLSVMLALPALAAETAATVSVRDSGVSTHPSRYECTSGHTIETRSFTIESAVRRYSFAYSGCIDPSHGEERPSSEGNFGMPTPSRCNYYAAGFLGIIINGKDAVRHRVIDMQVLETGARGSFQALFAHPDATVGLRLLMYPDSNHVLCHMQWIPKPGATINTVTVKLITYPSYFTTFNNRVGDRHCMTPRTDQQQSSRLDLVAGEDTSLLFYDTVFDVARGEGEGPCGVVIGQEGLTGGHVEIAAYPVVSYLDFAAAAGQAKMAFYDFAGMTNAEAKDYFAQHAQEDLARLVATDFRPGPIQKLTFADFETQMNDLLANAADDGEGLRPKVTQLVADVKAQSEMGAGGDWEAEAKLAKLLIDSEEMLWKLRIFALLNRE